MSLEVTIEHSIVVATRTSTRIEAIGASSNQTSTASRFLPIGLVTTSQFPTKNK